MKTKLKSILAVALCAVGLSAAAAEPVTYLDWDDANKKMTNAICTAFELVTADTATFEAGKTYVVQGTVEQSVHGITVEGTSSNPTRLILCDGTKLTVTGQSAAETAGLNVSNGTAIVICGQKDGTGELVATGGSAAAGIGGNAGQAAGTVTIYGGSVTALGKDGAAGIGGGMNKTDTGTVTFGAKFNVLAGNDAGSAQPIAQDDYVNDHSAKYAHIEPLVVAQFVKGGEVVAKFATAEEAVAALDDAQYADIDEFRIGLAADTVFDFGGRTNRVVILHVGNVENTLKNVLLDCAGDYVVTGMVGTVVFGEGVRIEKETGFRGGLVELIIKGGLYKSDPSWYCEDGYSGARRYDENEHLNGLYAILPEAAIAVTVSKGLVPTHYATLQDAFNLAIGENEEVTLRLFNNLELGTAVTKLEGNKFIHLLPGEAGTNTITRIGAEPVIEIGWGAKLEISDVIFDGANVTSEKPMIEVAGKTVAKFGWLIAGDGFVVSNAVGGAVHVGNGGKFELDGVAKIIDNTTGGKPKNVIIEDKQAIVLKNGGAVTDGNYAQIGVWSGNPKFMIPGGQFGTVDKSFADGDISVAEPWVGFINDLDGTLHHAAGAKIAAAPAEPKKTYKRWVGGEYKELVEEGYHLISREKSIVSVSPELIWTARQEAPAAEPAPAVLDWTDTTLTLAVSNGCDYALVTDGMAETNWVSMVKTDNTYAFARPAGDDYLCLRRYSITPSNIVSAATAYSVRVAAGTKDDPWLVGAENPEDVTAWTNGNEFVVSGDGTVSDLSKLASKVTVEKLTIKDATVTVAASDAFQGFGASGSEVSLSLPDGWQGELPDEGGNWYGATVTLTAMPLTVKNVTFLQRYPWNGLVDITCDLSGAGKVTLNVTVLTNGVAFCEAMTLVGKTTIDLGTPGCATNGVRLVWDAAADLPAGFKVGDISIEMAVEKVLPGQLWKGGPIWAECNVGATKPTDYGILTNFNDAATAVTAAMGAEWRVPTAEDFTNLVNNCDHSWTNNYNNTGVYGYVVTSKDDPAKFIFMPAAGFKHHDVGRDLTGEGYYWSASPHATDSLLAASLKFRESESAFYVTDSQDRNFGMSVRAVRDASAISAKSAAGALDLTVGDRVAKDVETLVVDPAWDETDPSLAKVFIDGEEEPRQYTVATNDTWETAALEPGRYELEMQTSCSSYPAIFWKLGDDWVVFDSSNITADVTFEAGKTYLFFGTNTADGVTLKVEDGAKFFYDEGASAGLKDGTLELPKRYGKEIVEDGLYQIVEKIKGCEDNPWDIGEGVTAYTNGTELVIGGEGTVADLSEISDEVKGEVESLTIATNGVTGVASEAFEGVGENGMVALTLPDGWQGELPDDEGNWYGARNVSLTAYPLAVKNVTFAQRYPWNGKVDVGFTLTGPAGETNVVVTVCTNGTKIADFTAAVTIPEDGVLTTNLVWDADAAGLAADFKSDDVTVEVAFAGGSADGDGVQLWENGPYWATSNVGESENLDHPEYGELYKFDDATNAVAALDNDWRLPTKADLDALKNRDICSRTWDLTRKGWTFTGTGDYASNSIFMPAAGYRPDDVRQDAGTFGYYWSSTPTDSGKTYNFHFGNANPFVNEGNRDYGMSVRAVRDVLPPVPSAIAAKSEAGALDLRTAVALDEYAVTVAGVGYSDTAWGAATKADVTLGWTNLTTGATGVLKPSLSGEDVTEVDLPQKDGDYLLTHSTGDLTSFVKFTVTGYPLGSEGNPWEIGAHAAADVIAFSNGTGTVTFKPVRGTVTKAGLETITNAMGGASFPAKLIAADGSETNDLVMVLGASGTAYDTIADALAANEASYTLFEVKGYFVSYDANGAAGEMATDTFVPTISTNLTANAYSAVGYAFAGWTTNGSDEVAYADRAAGVDFAQPGETLALKAKWTVDPAGVKPADFAALTAALTTATNQAASLPVTVTLTNNITVPQGGVVKVYASPAVTFAGTGKFDVTAERPALFNGYPVGTGLKPEDLDRFVTDKDVKAYFEDGKVVVRGRGESEEFPWLIGTAGHEDEVTAWAGNEMILTKPTRGTASVAALQSVTNALNGYVPGLGELKVISADGTATNDVVMLLGSDGVPYDTLADVLAADPMPETVWLFEVKGYFVSYDGNGAAGTMATDTFIPTIPTNLTANAYTAVGYAFAGWTTNGSDKVAYADRAAGVDFAQPGETLALKAKWTDTGVAVETFDALTNALVAATNQAASLPVTVNLTDDITVPQGGVVEVYASPAVTFAGAGKFDVSGIVPQFGEPVTVGEGLAEGDLDRFDADGVSKPVFEEGKVVLHARGESADFPWVLDGAKGVTAWVDPALTNLAAVVIDNGMPTATNEIDLVALTNGIAVSGYDPALKPLNALLKVADGGETTYVKPVNWIGADGSYKTIAEALEAGETAVIPNFITEEIPEEIAETGRGADGKTYTAVVVNKPAGSVADPIKAIYAEGLLDIATSEKKNVTLEVTPTNVEDVAQSTVTSLTNVLLTALKDQEGHPMRIMETNIVDLSVYYNEAKQTALNSLIAIHIPWTINAEYTYGVSRMHGNPPVAQAIPEAEQPPDDLASGDECFVVDKTRNEIVLYVKNFSDYLIGGTMPLVPRIGASIKWKLCYATGSLFAQLKLAVTNGQASAVEDLKFVFEDRIDGVCTNAMLWGASANRSEMAAVLTGWTGLPAGTWRYVDVNGDALTAVKGGNTGTFGVQSGIDTANGTVATSDRKIELYKKNAVIDPDNEANQFLGWVVWKAYGEEYCAPVGEGEIAGMGVAELPVAGPSPTPRLVIVTGPASVPGSGTVKYPAANASTGLVKEKANATWTATADAGSVFAGWVAAEGAPQGVADRLAALSANERRDKKLTIKVGAGEQIRPTDVAATWVRIDADAIRAVGLTSAGLVVDSKSYVTATVSGLPTGLKFDKKTLAITGAAKKSETKTVKVTVKNASGYTWKQSFAVTVSGGAVTDVVAANDCAKTGTPVIVSGDAALGKVTGAKVYVAGKKASIKATPAAGSIFLGWYEDAAFTTPATNLPKGYLTAAQSVVVPAEGLELYARFAKVESWAVGTFDGVFYDGDTNACGTVTFTVSSKGKVSGKVKADGATYSFSAAMFDDVSEIEGAKVFVAHPTVKVGRETLTLELAIGESDVSGLGFAEISFGEEADAPFAMAVQNGWKLKPAPLPSFPTGKKALSFDTPEGLKITFAAKGVAKVSGKVAGVSVSATTQVLPVAWRSTMTPNLLTRVCVYVPPKRGFDGFCAVYDVVFEVGEGDAFVRVIK